MAAAPAAAAATALRESYERPDVLGAQLLARTSGHRVLVTGLTSETSQTWVNPDGSLTSDEATGPVRVQRDEKWLDVDTTLRATKAGFEPAVVPGSLVLSDGGDRSLVSVSSDTDAGAVKLGLGWSGTLPVPTVEGDTATYAEVQPGVDLQVQALPTGFEQSVILKEKPTSTPTFTLPLTLNGLTTAAGAEGNTKLQDSSGDHVGDIGAAVMYDSSDEDTPATSDMSSKVTTTTGGARSLVLTPDTAMLNDPDTVYPVVLDPVVTLTAGADTYVKAANSTANYGTETKIAVGQMTSVANDDNRGFVVFGGLGTYAGKHIITARLQLSQMYSVSCTPSLTSIYQVTQGWSETAANWGNQPSVDTALLSSAVHAQGGSCGGSNYVTFPNSNAMATLFAGWANGTTPNYGLTIRADESSTAAAKYFRSRESTEPPRIELTYNSLPAMPAGRTITPCYVLCASTTATASTASVTPKLSGQSTDADGDALSYTFEVYAGAANPPAGAVLTSGTVGGNPSGQRAYWQVPAGKLGNGSTYEYRVKAVDGTNDSGKWSSYLSFIPDTVAPSAPTVSSSTYPGGAWNTTTPVPAGSFTFTKNAANTDVQEYSWRSDDGQSGSVPVTAASNSTTITPQAGWRTLKVATIDKAGNRSPDTSYSFGASAAVTSPGSGASTQRYAHLTAVAPAGSGSVTWKYRLQATDAWQALPLAGGSVTSAGTAVTAWPVTASSDGVKTSSPDLKFDLTSVLGGALAAKDGAVQLQAVFGAGTASTTVNDPTVTLDQNAFGGSYATEDVGPGSVSLLTGNYSVSATDASIDSYGSDLTLSRTFNSRTATTPGLFGPGWISSLGNDSAGSNYTGLSDLGSSVVATDGDGGKLVFAKTGTGGTYVAQGDAEGLKLVASGGDANGPTVFTLSDDDGSVTTFQVPSNWSAAASLTFQHSYPVTAIVQAGDASATTYSYAGGRPTRILAPNPTGSTTCNSSFVIGCRALDLTYVDVNGSQQVSAATLKTFDGTGTLVVTDVACFSYNSLGQLFQTWDPRITGSTCGAAVLPMTYRYDSVGRLYTITPPGLARWVIAYDGPDLTSRMSTVTRTHTGGTWGTGSEVNTVQYDVPIGNDTDAASGYHPDLSAATIAGWAQTDQPLTATAVFEPGDTVPALVAGGDFRDANITAMNADGRTTNTAVYTGTGQAGWRIDTTEQDDTGRQLRTLSAANRDRALGRPDAGALSVSLPVNSADAARVLDTVNVYTLNPNEPDPQQATEPDLVDSFGPLHQVTLPDGTQAPARLHTHLTYDTGAESGHPAGGTLRLVTASTEGASLSGAATATNETDQRTTVSSYSLSGESTGWNLRTPVRSTSYTGAGTSGTAITNTTLTDPATSLVTETRMPSDTAGTTAGTTVNTYYTAGTTNNAGCVNTAWVKLLCKTAPKVQPGVAALPGLMTKQVTYDYLLRPVVTTETAAPSNGTGTAITRTTTTNYQNGGLSPRPASTAVTGGLSTDTAVPAQYLSYDSATGLALTITATSAGAPLTTGYDDFGRVASFTDADGAVTSTAYDARGRVGSTTDPKGTTTFGYDSTSIVSGGADHRGLTTSTATTGLSGTATAVYDGGGVLRTYTYPNGITADYVTDETGDVTKVTYSKSGTVWFSDAQGSSVHGQWRSHDGLPSSQDYSYDGIGRLTNTRDDSNTTNGCVQRTYAFAGVSGLNGNRSSLVTNPSAANGDCQTATSTTQALSYDSADRLSPTGVAAGLVYDTYGRITTLPAALTGTGSTDVANGFYSNDLVASQTTSSPARIKTWTLDASLQRFRTFTDNVTGSVVTKTNHYDDAGSDSPDWIDEGDGTSTRYTSGLDGNLAASTTYDSTGTITNLRFNLCNLHGDLVTTASATAATFDGSVFDTDDYGNPKANNPSGRYGWLGGQQRSTDSVGGPSLMGVRLYVPAVGRFLQTDPVLGGSSNSYDYANQDPVNRFDLDGRCVKYLGAACKIAGAVASVTKTIGGTVVKIGKGCVTILGKVISIAHVKQREEVFKHDIELVNFYLEQFGKYTDLNDRHGGGYEARQANAYKQYEFFLAKAHADGIYAACTVLTLAGGFTRAACIF